jgi:hypothetical protein
MALDAARFATRDEARAIDTTATFANEMSSAYRLSSGS